MAHKSPSFPRFLRERRRRVPYPVDPVGALAEDACEAVATGVRRYLPASPRALLQHLQEVGAAPVAFAAAQLAAVEYGQAVEARTEAAQATR